MADAMPLGQPVPDDPTDPPGGDLHPDLTDEQVEAALRGDAAPPPADDDEPPPPDEPVPVAAEPAADDTPPVEEPAAEAPAPELTADERLAALESQLRLEKLEREKAEAVAERERYLHSRNAGELGYLKQVLAKREAQPEMEYDRDAAVPAGYDDIRSDIKALKSDRVAQGVAEELNNFHRAYPDAAKDEEALTKIVEKKLPDYREFLSGDDAKLARTMARSLLKESYAELRIEREQAARATASKASYDQAQALRARKIAAAPASTTRTAPARPTRKSVDELTDAEVDALANEYVRSV